MEGNAPHGDDKAGLSEPETQTSTTLLIFTKYPTPGFAKTRLIPLLGPDGAAQVSRAMTERICRAARRFRQQAQEQGNGLSPRDIHVRVCYVVRETDLTSNGSAKHEIMKQWLGQDLEYVEQRGESLGERLRQAFADVEERSDQIIVVGSDIPGVSVEILTEACSAISHMADVVLGPAADGGYYLLGLRRSSFDLDLFTDISWSTEKVLEQTVSRIEKHSKILHRLETLVDIDRPEDYPVWIELQKSESESAARR
uniref:Glycosyltransferase n=1 Tax=Compsopogon caeruleus TaxID=31354 RepID=A0A7S1T617_9RHOD|mmetsp:Transcript_11406/g.23125  ORF Transcript_11406/g.23125 Transcript_11406/m.23125 type:complete len:255 (+) Transcript_11406:199-963(+)